MVRVVALGSNGQRGGERAEQEVETVHVEFHKICSLKQVVLSIGLYKFDLILCLYNGRGGSSEISRPHA